MKMNYSLRFRLLAGAVLSIVLALAGAGVVLSNLFTAHLRARFDHELANHLDQLAANLSLDSQRLPIVQQPLSDPRFQRPLSGLYWEVVVEGTTRLRSRSLWDAVVLALPEDRLSNGELHRHEAPGPDGAPVIVVERLLQFPAATARFQLVVAASRTFLDQARADFDRTLLASLLILAVVLTIAATAQVILGLRPLVWLRAELAEIRAGRQQALKIAVPVEVKPLVDDLNHLLAYSNQVVERARVQTGNLAHALKTGLAVIGNDLDELDAAMTHRARTRLAEMLRHINYHLGRARAAAAQGLPGWRTEVAPTIAALCRTLASLYRERALTFATNCTDNLSFAGEKEDLEEILGNLLDNACKWCRQHVEISADWYGLDTIIFMIADDGLGLPPGSEALLANRGMRLDETVPGSGLGLGIVRDLCALYGGSVTFSRATLGGLQVNVILPGIPLLGTTATEFSN